MHKKLCLLCRSDRLYSIQTVKVRDLIKIYKRYLGFVPLELNNSKYKVVGYMYCERCGLRFFYPSIVGGSSFYSTLQAFPWYYLGEKDEFSVAKHFIKSTDCVLEVGSGSGKFLRKINPKTYLGIDPSAKAVLSGKADGINLKRSTIENFVKGLNKKYDIVCSFQVVEHVKNPEVFISACITALRKGGKLIISVPSFDGYFSDVLNPVLNLPPHHQTHWNNKSLKHLAKIFNMKVIKIKRDKLDSCHKALYLRTILSRKINRWFMKSDQIVETSFFRYLVEGFLQVVSLLIVKITGFPKNGVTGQSVTIVYEKK